MITTENDGPVFMMDASIQVISDIHLELRTRSFEVFARAPVLALLGDIGNPFEQSYWDFLRVHSSRFDQVWVVAGNHEFYHNEYFQTHAQIQQICSEFANVTYFHRNTLDWGSFRVVGCVLWSKIVSDHAQEIFRRLNDFRHIRYGAESLSLESYQNIHQLDLDWLKSCLQDQSSVCATPSENPKKTQKETPKVSPKKTIVLTHHAPLIRSGHPQYHGSPLTSAFANPLESLCAQPVVAWLFGHTHWPVDVCFGNRNWHTRVMSSPLGYENESLPSSPYGALLQFGLC